MQSGERVDLPSFPAKLEKVCDVAETCLRILPWPCIAHAKQLCTSAQSADRRQRTMQPMMEMVAGSNVWYQAHVLRATAAKLRVLFPGDLPSCSLCPARVFTYGHIHCSHGTGRRSVLMTHGSAQCATWICSADGGTATQEGVGPAHQQPHLARLHGGARLEVPVAGARILSNNRAAHPCAGPLTSTQAPNSIGYAKLTWPGCRAPGRRRRRSQRAETGRPPHGRRAAAEATAASAAGASQARPPPGPAPAAPPGRRPPLATATTTQVTAGA